MTEIIDSFTENPSNALLDTCFMIFDELIVGQDKYANKREALLSFSLSYNDAFKNSSASASLASAIKNLRLNVFTVENVIKTSILSDDYFTDYVLPSLSSLVNKLPQLKSNDYDSAIEIMDALSLLPSEKLQDSRLVKEIVNQIFSQIALGSISIGDN